MTPSKARSPDEPWVLQFCHGYDGPFLDCARQYAVLFKNTPYRVCTVYLTGQPSEEVERGSASDEVIFLGYDSKDVRGLKLGAMRRLREIVAGRDFRVCIAHRFKPIYIALLATRLPVIGVHHAFGVYQRRMRRWFINRFRSRLLLLGVSNAVRDEMRSHLPGWEPERIETLYNRIDVAAVQAEQVSREAARKFLGLPQDAWVVGNVGRLHPDKDQATLIRGFAQALPQLPPGSLLTIMGSGRLESSLKALAAELGVAEQVRFLGQVPRGRRYFKAFDVFALTSDHEPFGMVLLEAMVAGVPLIVSNCGGGKEVVEGVGVLFPLGDAGALAEGLARMSALTSEQCSLCARMMIQRQSGVFSDVAVRARFWQLDMIASFTLA
ncbi:MAG: glycosyltransferase [Pseudomonadaceae bacterium]|uniref:glycosyltransferase n=1 Tax=Stutzerimonas kunmingensis TaxID=1211807 RepID=UPI00056B5932|nr:glycosyltransferase [Stutzerimonas kunmingensis]MCQ2041764.1 glycosyltransferase [Stutzerimonas kunmingensis]SFJ43012.1 Glycosyltransferase Family 4 [Stutzerimonas kunmingensis]